MSDDFWVFGYGSLMWNPGFPHLERRHATLEGLHRALCIYSWVHRGTQDKPGLVLGLDRGGSCEGVAFRVAAADSGSVLSYLRAREQVTGVYLESEETIRFADGTGSQAVTYIVDRAHEQYAGALSREEMLARVTRSAGKSGENWEYVVNTADHLDEAGIHDPALLWLRDQLLAVRKQGPDPRSIRDSGQPQTRS